MIRRPLRPLARILSARAEGRDPNRIEAEERAVRTRARRGAEQAKAKSRLLLLGVVFILGFTTIAGRMALMAASVPVEPRVGAGGEPILAQRADITDRNGAILATNLVTASLYAQPLDMIDPVRASSELARIFPDLDAKALLARFSDGRKFVWIKRTLSPEQRQAVHDLGEPGLLFGPRETRLYPNGAIAAHILGGASFGREGVHAAEIFGTAGVERQADVRLRDPERTATPLRLSIDIAAQTALEEVLSQGMIDMRAKGAIGILMEADTGQIRAIASLPDFDPNLRPPLPTSGDPADSPLFNRAAQGRYELGSVFKIFTIADALDRGVVTPTTLIDTTGPLRWGRFTIRDSKDYGPRLTVEDVIAKSSNIGTARIAISMGAQVQQDFLKRLGLMDVLPIEVTEALRAPPLVPQRWSDLTTMTVSYGHGLAVSPLHLAMGYASIVNGGLKVTPSIIASDARPSETDRIVSEATSLQIRAMLRRTVQHGTAKQADVPGYDVGGKTGTADKPNASGGYARNKVISTFAGVFPAHDPRYVMVIGLDEPENTVNGTALRTAGWTAAPVFAKALRRIAPILGLRPDERPVDEEPSLYTLAVNE